MIQDMAMAASKHYLVETADKLKDGLGNMSNRHCLSSSKISLDLDRTSGVVSNLTFI